MKLLSYLVNETPSFGLLTQGGVVDLADRMKAPDLKSILGRLDEVSAFASARPDHQLEGLTLLPPIPNPARMLAVGLNYQSHVTEGGNENRQAPGEPNIFLRLPSSVVGHGEPIVRPNVSDDFDYEGELAVIIGKPCRHVAQADAMSVISGYSCFNEGSIRDWQRKAQQNTAGKNFWRSGSFGPCLVTKDEVADIQKATLKTRLNGVEVQSAVISDMIYSIAKLIEYCSTFTNLEPGDVFITGTTSGVGSGRKPPLWMKPGDKVEVEISGVGLLQNGVVQES